MLANWKGLALAIIGVATISWLGPRNDNGEAYPASELAMDAQATPGCVAGRAARCTIDVRYAYPAGDLFVLSEDDYF